MVMIKKSTKTDPTERIDIRSRSPTMPKGVAKCKFLSLKSYPHCCHKLTTDPDDDERVSPNSLNLVNGDCDLHPYCFGSEDDSNSAFWEPIDDEGCLK